MAVLLCILLHELGHAVVMRAYGYRAFDRLVFLRRPGHSASRPLRRPPSRPVGRYADSFAGPASGFILAAVLALGLHYLGGYPVSIFESSSRDVVPVGGHAQSSLLVLLPECHVLHITVMWGLLNLLPIYPLDGGQIAQQIFVLTNPQDAMRQSLILSVIVGGMMAAIAFVQWR